MEKEIENHAFYKYVTCYILCLVNTRDFLPIRQCSFLVFISICFFLRCVVFMWVFLFKCSLRYITVLFSGIGTLFVTTVKHVALLSVNVMCTDLLLFSISLATSEVCLGSFVGILWIFVDFHDVETCRAWTNVPVTVFCVTGISVVHNA